MKPEAVRFWSKVVKGSGDGCWMWAGTVNGRGYATFATPPVAGQAWGSAGRPWGRKVQASRWAWQEENGRAPLGQLDHECHNADLACPGGITCRHRRCIRPSHLREATQSENIQAARKAERRNMNRGLAPTPEKSGGQNPEKEVRG